MVWSGCPGKSVKLATYRDAARTLGDFASCQLRRARAYVTTARAQLVYHFDYAGPVVGLGARKRAKRILNYLVATGAVLPRHYHKAGRVSIGQLALVHDYDYLERVDDEDNVRHVIGEQDVSVDPAELIAQQRRMVAGTVLAARLAVEQDQRGRPVVNLGGGLHHAHADHGEGFCFFNDVAVAIAVLRAAGYWGRILIVDLDLHQGNGTRRIFADDATVFTFSIHASDWDDAPAGRANLDVALGPGVSDAAYLAAIAEHLPRAFAMARPDLVFYLAGVDVAADDALGNWRVSPGAILERDQIVFGHIGERPSVWLLAGGYGQEAWRHSARTLSWLLGGPDDPIPSRHEHDLAHFRKIASHFSGPELSTSGDDNLAISEEDIFADLAGPKTPEKVLGYYSKHGVETALERYGILPHIRQRVAAAVRLEVDLGHPTGELLRLYTDDGRADLLVEIVLRVSREFPPRKLLFIEWLTLQNPRAPVSPSRPLLPGQRNPGLGCLHSISLMLLMACERLDFDGLVFVPGYYHVAAQAKGMLSFLAPEAEARFLLMQAALEGLPLAEATRVVHSGSLRVSDSGEIFAWETHPMVLPVSQQFRDYINGSEYAAAVRTVMAATELVRHGSAPKAASGLADEQE